MLSFLSFRRYQRREGGRQIGLPFATFHQRELRVINFRRINLEIEDIERSKETATTERDLRKLQREKDQTYRLITYESQCKYEIAVFKKCIQTKRFTDKLIVVRNPTETENPTADNYASRPDCRGFSMGKTKYRHKLDYPTVTRYSHKDGKKQKQQSCHLCVDA